ncbi:MAG: L,D-transpeptidase family protein [Xanthobacteraceae bacterium]
MTFSLTGRVFAASVILAAGLVLAGCKNDGTSINAKAMKPLPEKLVADIQKKDMDAQSPILVRLFKQEAELEVWKQDRSGRFALLKTYPICRWSGDLGPKIREGDRQAPEGFYSITPAQMNPQSAYYLSFNMGYPNAFDRALGRTGSQLMVHGDCSSRGCYAMTDEQISEIYALGRESFFGGQRAFQVQAYPFRMTPANFARHRNNPNMPFWKMLKEGNDHFEVTRQEPKVDVCEKRYVFDAQAPANASAAPVFDPAGRCPAYQVPAEIANAVRDKQREDEVKIAELVSRGTPTVALNRGIDGGMNAVFAAKLPNASTGLSEPVTSVSLATAPGTIPGHVNPPRAAEPPVTAFAPAAPDSMPTQVAAAGGESNFFSTLARKIGLASEPAPAAQPAQPRSRAAKPEPRRAASPARTAAARAPARTQDAKIQETKIQETKAHDAKPVAPVPAVRPTPPASLGVAADKPLTGAAPVVSANSFDARWSATR